MKTNFLQKIWHFCHQGALIFSKFVHIANLSNKKGSKSSSKVCPHLAHFCPLFCHICPNQTQRHLVTFQCNFLKNLIFNLLEQSLFDGESLRRLFVCKIGSSRKLRPLTKPKLLQEGVHWIDLLLLPIYSSSASQLQDGLLFSKANLVG